MKVGIVTLFGDNYGNKLQNLAVQRLFEQHGCEAETIILEVKQGIRTPCGTGKFIKKLTPSYMLRAFKSRFKNKYHYKNDRDGILESIRFAKNGDWQSSVIQRSESFSEFTKRHIKLSANKLSLINKASEWLSEYDYFISGSDQVWNPTYPETSSLNFLQFAPMQKRIALAPSIGLATLPRHVEPSYKRWINEIPHLSVREEKGARIIKELTGRNATVLPDPTLCIAREDWELIEEKPDFDTDAPYVFTYFLGNETKKYRKYIEEYAKQNGYKIINIFDLREPEHYAVNPAEFVYLIHHAKAVFTDSFHGSVFSIIMKTPFVVFDRIEDGGTGMSSRIETLLGNFSLEDRRYPLKHDRIEKIDFSSSDEVIKRLRERTDTFISNALTSSVESEEVTSSQLYVLKNKADCSGCTACVDSCPKKCIEMKQDSEGFYYPVIDEERCIDCGLCRRICPSVQGIKADAEPQAYVGYSTEKQLRKNSSSGGIFGALAEQIVSAGGHVYGAAFDKDFTVRHTVANNKEELAALRTSKYVQSDVRGLFPEIEEFLKNGETVYFSGTPCQVEGLLSYLGKEYDNLYTQDIVCHGVPSPKAWSAYLGLIKGEKKSVSFRDKKYGWHYFSMRIRTNKKKHVKRLDEDTYIRLFLDNVILRPSCHACHFKKDIRRSDLTLADCWNSESLGLSLKDDDKGLSMIFANSEKGKKLLASLDNSLVLEEVDYSKALKTQSAATSSVRMTEQRTVFFESAQIKGYEATIRDWYQKNPVSSLRKKIIYLKTKLRNIIK